jgi:RecG-like helicase
LKRKSVLLKSMQQEAQEKERLENDLKEEVEVIESTPTIKPKDYKKIVGLVGVENSGKALIALLSAYYIYSVDKKNVSILDLSDSQNYCYYFITDEDDQELFTENGYIQVKNIKIYTKDYLEDKLVFQKLDNLRQGNDLIIINFGSNINSEVASIIDNIYIVSDSDQTHIIGINNFMKKLNEFNVSQGKVKLIFNKMLDYQFSKQLAELSIYDLTSKQQIYKKIPEFYSIKAIVDKEIFKLVNDFDVRCLEKDEDLKNQISKLANDMYSIENKNKGFFGNLKSIFK